MISNAKDFGKDSKVQTEVVQSQSQNQTEIDEKQKASAGILNNQKSNKMVEKDPNGKSSKEDPKEDTESQKTVSNEIKKLSNIKKRRNLQKFNLGNPPKIEETKLDKKDSSKKDDTKKQETKDDQKKQNQFEEFKEWPKWFFAVIGFGRAFGLLQLWFQLKTMKQIIECLNHYSKNRIKLIFGIPGIGKASAIKKVLSDMKKSGVEVFYFSFGDFSQDSKKVDQEKQQFYALMTGIKKSLEKKQNILERKLKLYQKTQTNQKKTYIF